MPHVLPNEMNGFPTARHAITVAARGMVVNTQGWLVWFEGVT